MPVPLSRDRLARPVDISTLLDGATRRVNLIVDEPGLQRVGLSGHGFRNQLGNVGGGSPGTVGVQRVNNGRDSNQRRAVEARCGGGGGRGRRGQLPSWYPRTPLRDITGIMRAIERRRAELGLNQDAEAPQEENNAANTQVEPELVSSTPVPTISIKAQSSPAAQLLKMKASHADWTVDSENITLQKKLLDSIEMVREGWLENQRKLERTPIAKRVEREKKVRVLMSMR